MRYALAKITPQHLIGSGFGAATTAAGTEKVKRARPPASLILDVLRQTKILQARSPLVGSLGRDTARSRKRSCGE
jgi:hypothetical protein